jgi:hypothetical protein
MRRIYSKQDEEKRRKKNQWTIGIILIVVMLGSTFGIIVDSFGKKTQGNPKYNGYEFVKQGSYWYTQIGSKQYIFMYNPYEVQESFNITVINMTYINSYKGYPLYIYSDNYQAGIEISRNFEGIALRMQNACLNGLISNCSESLPVKDCTDNFIIIKEFNESGIYQQDKCVFITGKKEDLIKLTDEYLFKVSGIKN